MTERSDAPLSESDVVALFGTIQGERVLGVTNPELCALRDLAIKGVRAQLPTYGDLVTQAIDLLKKAQPSERVPTKMDQMLAESDAPAARCVVDAPFDPCCALCCHLSKCSGACQRIHERHGE